MDTLTHALSGALVGRAMSASSKVVKPKALIFIGAFAGLFPDLDFVFRFISPEMYMWNHRGITHSLFFLPLWAAMISMIFAYGFNASKNKEKWIENSATFKTTFKHLYLTTFLGILIHVAGDLITSFGTMLLWPIKTRFEIGSVFIIDLIFTSIIVLGLFVSAKYGKTIKEKAKYGLYALIVLFAYVGLTQVMKYTAIYQLKEAVEAKIITNDGSIQNNNNIAYYAYPNMISFTNWTGVAYDKEKEKYYFMSIFLHSKNEPVQEFEKWGGNKNYQEKTKELYENHKIFEFARWFVIHPYVVSVDDNCVVFEDMRYKQPLRGNNPFSYGACVADKK